MGPALFNAGNGAGFLNFAEAELASMGPALFNAGNVAD